MKTLKRLGAIPTLLAIFVALSALAAFADPPSRAVRLKYMAGEVSVQPGGVNDWVAAVVNRPLTTSDRVWTDKNSRAELNLGSASLRANAETSLTFTNVSDDIVQVELDQGTLNLHIRHLFGGETYEIDTPNLAFTILKSGDYRFDVDPNADTTYITVWHGEGEATGQGPGVRVHSGEQASFTNGTSLQHEAYGAPDRDGFDDWCQVRSDREDHAESYRYVSADVVGADDLDDYGTWRSVGEYGPVWVPRVAPGWAPYHYGHWVWVEPWGWTWVDDAPWGFAPCHYGRWVFYDGFWAWSPGPPAVVAVRPVYAPALVAWVGGPHFGVGIGFGGGVAVGWFPLGWGEPYVPAYSVSRTYFQQVNVTNTHITNITNVTNNYYVNNNTTVVNNNVNNIHYVNQNVAGAVTAVPQRTLTNSEPVARNAVAVTPSQLKAAPVATAAPVAPVRNSVLGANAGKSAVAPPQSAVARTVVAKVAPPARPVPFEAKQEVLAKNPGRPLDAQTEANLRANLPHPPVNAQPNAPNRGTNQPMHPGAVETPTGMTQPHPSTPATAPKPGTPAVAATPSTPAAPVRNVPRPPQPGNAPAAPSESVHSQPVTPATPAAPARAVPRPPQPGGAAPVATPSTPRQPERAPAVVNERPANNTQHDQPQLQQTSHHAAPFEQARPAQPAPIYTPHPPHEEQRPPQHEQTKAPAHTQTQHEAPREHNNR